MYFNQRKKAMPCNTENGKELLEYFYASDLGEREFLPAPKFAPPQANSGWNLVPGRAPDQTYCLL